MTFDIDNYGSLVIKVNLAKKKGDAVVLARAIDEIKEMAYQDSLRSGNTLEEMFRIIVDNYPSMKSVI